MKYYVYVYLDRRVEKNFSFKIPYYSFVFFYEPFYVGIGKLKHRIYEHLYERYPYNPIKFNKIQKIISDTGLNPIIFKLFENLSEKRAKKIERQTICSIGRLNLKTGPLTNLTDGGDGTFGYKPSETALLNWKKAIKKFYSDERNRKKMGHYSTLEGMQERYGKEEGKSLYFERIERIRKNVRKTYEDPSIREKCANRGEKNGMFGITPPSAIRVSVNGKIYSSIFEASRDQDIPYTTLSQRLRSKNFVDYKIL